MLSLGFLEGAGDEVDFDGPADEVEQDESIAGGVGGDEESFRFGGTTDLEGRTSSPSSVSSSISMG